MITLKAVYASEENASYTFTMALVDITATPEIVLKHRVALKIVITDHIAFPSIGATPASTNTPISIHLIDVIKLDIIELNLVWSDAWRWPYRIIIDSILCMPLGT